MILAPVVLERFTFGTVLETTQYGGIAAIIVGVVMLTYTAAQDKMVADDDLEDENTQTNGG